MPNYADTPVPVIAPEQLRSVEPQGKVFYASLVEHFITMLEDPVVEAKVTQLIKRAIPGRIFDSFAASIYAMAVKAIAEVLREVTS